MSPLVMLLLALDMGSAARDLAREVSATLAHEPVALGVKNVSSLGVGEAAEITRVFEESLKAAGQPPAAVVQVTISQNLTDFVLAAEVRRAGERQVLLESWPRAGAKGAPRVTLQPNLLWEQDQPILDAVRSVDITLVLDAASVSLANGTLKQSAFIAANHPWPRDLRGHLALHLPAFTAWLPGTICRGLAEPRLSVECSDSEDPWLLGPGVLAAFDQARNFFAGRIFASSNGAHELPPFFAAAPAGDFWLLAGVDGRARLYTTAWDEAATIGASDGDVAGIQTPCGPRILLAGTDSVQPFEIRDTSVVPAGPIAQLPGPVTALWSAGVSATVITHDLKTGSYAAYSLAPACGS